MKRFKKVLYVKLRFVMMFLVAGLLVISGSLQGLLLSVYQGNVVEASENAEPVSLGELEIGSVVRDKAEWEWRGGLSYTTLDDCECRVEPIDWIVIAHDHFAEGATLLVSQELVASMAYNGDWDTTWHTSSLRSWMREVIYGHFTDEFKDAIVPVTTYSEDIETEGDTVFLLSQTELGGPIHDCHAVTQTVLEGNHGTHVEYFDSDEERDAQFNGEAKRYWTRSPDIREGTIEEDGEDITIRLGSRAFDTTFFGRWFTFRNNFVRPALNLNSETSMILNDEDGKYYIGEDSFDVEMNLRVEGYVFILDKDQLRVLTDDSRGRERGASRPPEIGYPDVYIKIETGRISADGKRLYANLSNDKFIEWNIENPEAPIFVGIN